MDVGYILRRVEDDIQTVDPEQTAVRIEADESWTYGELNALTNQYANALEQFGVRKGDSVSILLYNSIEYVALYFAIAKLGAIAVRLNFRLESEELEYVLRDSETSVLCFDATLAENIAKIRDRVPVITFICYGSAAPDWAYAWSRMTETSNVFSSKEIFDKADPVMLMYTSGTTGNPKGALWSHENTLWFASMQVMKWGFTSDTKGMTTGPLYHVGALEDIAIAVLLAGGTVVFSKSSGFQIEHTLDIIEAHQVTDCFMFPFMIYDMLKSPAIDTYALTSLKRIYTGGDPLTTWAIDTLEAKFPQIDLIQVFGLTEGTPIATALDPGNSTAKHYTAGKPMPFTQIKITDDASRSLKANEIGEICVKGPAVVDSYWNKPEKSAETFVDGWCHTGDLGYLDEDGYLTISGRKKDMIRSGGENIYPVEVENVLIRHEAIQDVAVIGLPDEKFIEKVCAVIVLKSGPTLAKAELKDFLKGKLASYKKPRQVEFITELPRTASGKVQKYKLREMYASHN